MQERRSSKRICNVNDVPKSGEKHLVNVYLTDLFNFHLLDMRNGLFKALSIVIYLV